jgi:serine/threonine protein phosphatase PrpC
MEIHLNPPLFLTEKGKRENNEDSIFPMPGKGTAADRLFIVCDGVGGSTKGEVASRLACDSLSGYFAHNEIQSGEAWILEAFDYTQNQFDKYLQQESAARGMGTTLVLMQIHEQGLTVAHCGDSRFYHFRKNRIIWQTFDHSMTNELVRQGLISAEEAASRPKSNRISRAIQGYSVHKSKPDTHFISEIEEGDLFFLCSDGILEAFSDTELTDVLSSEQTLNEKMEIIHQICEANSRDNFSAYLIEVDAVN